MQNYSGQKVPEAFKRNQEMLRFCTAFDMKGKNATNVKIMKELRKSINGKVSNTEMESTSTISRYPKALKTENDFKLCRMSE